MKASVVPKEVVSHYGSDDLIIGTALSNEIMGRKCKTSFEKPLFYEKTRKEMHCGSSCHYLLPDKQVVFYNSYKEN
jgi:hypothetical protein